MRKCYKRLVNVILVAVLVFAFNIVAMAQGTTTITLSKSSLAVGDTITVSVSGTESGSITVKYTSSMLNYISCSVSGASAEGNSVTFSGTSGDIVFKAATEGTASIIVSSSANSGSSTTLSIGSSGAAASTETTQATTETTVSEETDEAAEETTEVEAEEPAAEETAAAVTSTTGAVGSLNSDGGFDINGTAYVVSERYSDSEMPSGFSKKTIQIGSSTYSEPTNGTLTLLYLKPADNTSGSGVFYLYNEQAGTVSPFLMLGSEDSYVIISDNGSAPSSAFTSTSLEVTGGTATAYTIDGSEFYYVYGTNQDGASGWFVYDNTYKTISRVDESALSSQSGTTSTEENDENVEDNDNLYIEKLNLYRKIIMGLIVLCVVLLFIVINKAIRGRGDDDFDGDVFAAAPSRPSKQAKKQPRSIVFGARNKKDNDDVFGDDDYEDEDEYEEDYEDTSKSRYESESYESKRASSLNMMDLNDL